jgi:glycosyltransferase involved in cell wall biosynthesis
VVLTIHDHALACPRGQRIRPDLDPCPVIDRDRCDRCVRPAWIEAVRGQNRVQALLGLLRPGEGRRLFAARDAHLARNLDRVAAFIAPSRSAAGLFAQFHPAAAARTCVIPHGFAAAERPADPPPSSRPFVIGYFGALLPSKGIGLLADAARVLDPAEIRIAVNGGGPSDVVERLVRRSGARLEVRGPYRSDEIRARMGAVHAVAVPSLWPETFSIVVREAWTHRRPVLASETGALVEAAGPAGDRLALLPPGDLPAWTAAFRRLATDADWYARLAGPHAPEPFAPMLHAIMACYMGRQP